MRQNNGRLVVVVAAVAVAAVAIGGVLAYRQGPSNASADAAPLSAPTKAPSTSPTTASPSKTPSRPPTSTPTVTPSGPVKVPVNLAKLPKGREPQVPYLIGREVRGGAGGAVKIPGKEPIHQIARQNVVVLAVVGKGSGSELLKLGPTDGEVRRVADVSSIVSAADGSATAYAATRRGDDGGALKGGTLYADSGLDVETLKRPNDSNLRVLGYVDGKVYFRADTDDRGAWQFYSWTPGSSKATEITIGSPSALSPDGRITASMSQITDAGSCSDVTVVATGKRLWRTCESSVQGFTPDGRTAFGGPAYADGYCAGTAAALDATTGRLFREWSGCFHQTVAEDDQHLLIVADATDGGGEDGYGSRAIIRCTLTTGACELATPLSGTGASIGS
ncbi:hypothetical protein GCM10009789_52280 [Kribbella sancticallisti]|uniref:Uncharacterized protein n=1 Tax=Kribbella sancticallisti TaxID=460087 RepID=A0ABP4PUL3_9ACTN